MIFDPDAHFASMAPDPCTSTTLDHTTIQCMTPRITAMQYYLMGALAFSAVIEPAALYVAAYKLRDQRDSYLVVQTILASFAAFDIFHAAATIAGSGVQAVLPLAEEFNTFSAINFWVPLMWLLFRSAWFLRRKLSNLEELHARKQAEQVTLRQIYASSMDSQYCSQFDGSDRKLK
ncbi:hypothetical protein MBLNU13_g00844t1 [Cladosporium sp. NU13]